MGLKLKLEWFDLKTDECLGKERSEDLGEDGSVMERLGLPLKDNINNGGFDVEPAWVPILQPYFRDKIEADKYCYQVAFDNREQW